ncbi:MAG: T9SS C-terminal target domain-containing protein [Thermodesulfobacteriota bacterium]|nr:T9SS C-terminal target domain-containing protein [Thermodesulfobacteriota bacterium]
MKLRTCIGLMVGLLFMGVSTNAQALQVISGDITVNTTWGAADNEVLLRGAVFVRQPATLTILAGTTVYGEKASIGTLIIDRGAKINAVGTVASPIVFTSDQITPARGDWGGLILNGNAPLNVQGGVAIGEGDTGEYGGSNPSDNSGTLRYVRVEYAGIEFSPDNELNGIAFQGVGSGTMVDHIQVHANKDDGIEMFGGTVNAKYVLCTSIADDSFDWTFGWTGKAQFWVAQQSGDDADQGIEADNLEEDHNATPRSAPTIYNMTLIGDPDTNEGDESDKGMLLRRGTGCIIRNAIVVGFKEEGLDIDDQATYQQAQTGGLVVDNSIFWNNNPNFSDSSDDTAPPFTVEQFANTIMTDVQVTDPMLGAPYDLSSPDFRPSSGSPAVRGAVSVAIPPIDGFFESVDFIGGVDPDNDWTRQAWTTFGASTIAFGSIDIKANGQDGPMTVSSSSPVGLTISLDPGTYAGQNADLWLYTWVYTAAGWNLYSYVFPGGWRLGFWQTTTIPLTSLSGLTVFNGQLPAGAYYFYFVADDNADGVIDVTWWDAVEVTVQ